MSGKVANHAQSPNAAHSAVKHPHQKPQDYDMVDSEKDLAHFLPLSDILTSCHNT